MVPLFSVLLLPPTPLTYTHTRLTSLLVLQEESTVVEENERDIVKQGMGRSI